MNVKTQPTHTANWLRIRLKGRALAAPSWVIPGTLAENCRFLSEKVDEVGLLFFEQDVCLDYGKNELPPYLADLGLSFHVHLPMDLDWSRPVMAAENCLRLMDKVDFLNARLAVVHPPAKPSLPPFALASTAAAGWKKASPAPVSPSSSSPDEALEVFLHTWQKSGRKAADIALENIDGCDLSSHAEFVIESGMNICLDIGHIFAYNQTGLFTNRKIQARTRLFHMSASGAGNLKSRHLPLSQLAENEKELVLRLIAATPDDATMLPELFNWDDYSASALVLATWLDAT